jgi:hypothetical protein
VCLWLKKLHGDLGRSERCIVINCDKVGAIKLTKIQGPHGLRMLRQAPLALKGCSTQRSSLASAVLEGLRMLRSAPHPIASQRSKHIDVIYHHARECVEKGQVRFEYCTTNNMVVAEPSRCLWPSRAHVLL